jgi:hypothetical protein
MAFGQNSDEMMDFLKTMNPLLLMDIPLIQGSGTMNPMDQSLRFNDYVRYVDELHSFIVPVPPGKDPNLHMCYQFMNNCMMMTRSHVSIFSENSSLLFYHNGIECYGYRDIVYESILCLKEIKDIADFDQPITLSGKIPKYIMNL